MTPKPKIPKTITAGPFTYSVGIGGRPMANARLKENESDLLGHCDMTNLVIAVQGGMAHDALCEVLLHEVLHACINAVGQPLESMNSSTTEENAVRILAPTLLATLRANPKLLAFLTT